MDSFLFKNAYTHNFRHLVEQTTAVLVEGIRKYCNCFDNLLLELNLGPNKRHSSHFFDCSASLDISLVIRKTLNTGTLVECSPNQTTGDLHRPVDMFQGIVGT